MTTLYCACCGQPFRRSSSRGPAPLYCSRDCRRQIEVRRRVWASRQPAERAAAATSAPVLPAGAGPYPQTGMVWERASA
ncbi:hypothetical protein JJL56_10135 [Azospirillum sp. YIM DDC1]|jgi:hypothetical protein|uniref:DUF2256 domain-containing protein n=1 Tax=Azospirillum aestuarii TaxID=2802052 RepID=A0ABS1HXY1_9PROT|nr:hypothetical protein [Azospirillum aestuarii]MBK3778496.1 hypothetical protein [Azospirillum brasilense]MBK4719228.1 hypothetical protein [Azospirillum aestuarii]TWA90657.1 hypothetical protein FBY14_104161 [Azospirillum brasilense]